MDQQQAKFEGWAVVGLFGHQKEAGYVTTEYFGGAAMFRIEVPELPGREWVLERPERGSNWDLLPVGTKVQRAPVPARTRFVGPSAIYDMTPCTEAVARRAIETGLERPLIVVEMPKGKQLTTGEPPAATLEEEANDDESGIDRCPDCGAGEDEDCDCGEEEQ